MMTTMELECATLPESLSSLFRSARIRIQQRKYGGEAILSPVPDCVDETNAASTVPNAADILNSLNDVYAETDSRLDKNLEYAQLTTYNGEW